jgi:alpha/beta superfamily hydrolase
VVAADARAITFDSAGLALEGVLHLPAAVPAPAIVVCHPHPQYGGDMHNNVVVALCERMCARDIAALRFNTRGTGRSEGAFDNGNGERDDVAAGLTYLASLSEVDGTRIGLAGYSFGALIAAEAAGGHLRGLALISPPVAVADLRVAWGCPAVVVGGGDDDIAPADRLRVVAEAPGVELHIVDDADHSWWGSEDEMARLVGDFFERHLL